MNALKRDSECDWRKPELTQAGQRKFWNRQAPTYDMADMTVDNSLEIKEVVEHCRVNRYSELINLGGAIGCRDPKMILEYVYCHRDGVICIPPNKGLPQVFFNDLAEAEVARAEKEILARCQQCGVSIKFCAGPIHEVCKQIGHGSRTLLLGVYNVESFFNAGPCHDYPLAGFDEYLKNTATLGDVFWFDWLVFQNGFLSTEPDDLRLSAAVASNVRLTFRQNLEQRCRERLHENSNAIALQIVSVRKGYDDFFISHWYKKDGLCRLLSSVFPPNDYEVQPLLHLAKGFLTVIKKKGVVATGVITMLNNVLGNIIPSEQMLTLEAIKSLM